MTKLIFTLWVSGLAAYGFDFITMLKNDQTLLEAVVDKQIVDIAQFQTLRSLFERRCESRKICRLDVVTDRQRLARVSFSHASPDALLEAAIRSQQLDEFVGEVVIFGSMRWWRAKLPGQPTAVAGGDNGLLAEHPRPLTGTPGGVSQIVYLNTWPNYSDDTVYAYVRAETVTSDSATELLGRLRESVLGYRGTVVVGINGSGWFPTASAYQRNYQFIDLSILRSERRNSVQAGFTCFEDGKQIRCKPHYSNWE